MYDVKQGIDKKKGKGQNSVKDWNPQFLSCELGNPEQKI